MDHNTNMSIADSVCADSQRSDAELSVRSSMQSTVQSRHDDTHFWPRLVKDGLVGISWPLTILILFLIFKKQFTKILDNVEEFVLGKYKIRVNRSGKVPAEVLPDEDILSGMNKKILATLWHYQQQFKERSTRWTFTISVLTPEYPAFINSVRALVSQGFLAQDPKTQQFFLTDHGIAFCEKEKEELREAERFDFGQLPA